MRKVEKQNCLKCGKKCKRSEAKYCSSKCGANNRVGTKNAPFWKIASKGEIIDRLRIKFESVVIKTQEGCWSWKNKLDNGYGSVKTGIKKLRAHRVSWLIYRGEIPKGLFICHSCDNRECTNPEHLFLGTHKINMLDMIKKKRNRWKNFKLIPAC